MFSVYLIKSKNHPELHPIFSSQGLRPVSIFTMKQLTFAEVLKRCKDGKQSDDTAVSKPIVEEEIVAPMEVDSEEATAEVNVSTQQSKSIVSDADMSSPLETFVLGVEGSTTATVGVSATPSTAPEGQHPISGITITMSSYAPLTPYANR